MCAKGDDLYAHEPFVQELRELRMGFVLVAKPISHAELFEWVEELDRLGVCERGQWEAGPACQRRYFEYRIGPEDRQHALAAGLQAMCRSLPIRPSWLTSSQACAQPGV
jgi:hypothetical protein